MSTTPSSATASNASQRAPRGSVTGAATRAARHLGVVALFHLEGVAAAARGADVRVVDREAGLEALEPVDLGADDVRRAERVDDDADAVALDLVVALLRAAVEAERVLEAGAAAALYREAQHLGLAGRLLGLEVPDLVGSALGERDESGLGALGDLHGSHRSNVVRGRPRPRLCNDGIAHG